MDLPEPDIIVHGQAGSTTYASMIGSALLPSLTAANFLPGRKVLIGDNLSSHFSNQILQECEDNNIAFVTHRDGSGH